jgi:hypothetical protein
VGGLRTAINEDAREGGREVSEFQDCGARAAAGLPKRTRRTRAQIEADNTTKDALQGRRRAGLNVRRDSYRGRRTYAGYSRRARLVRLSQCPLCLRQQQNVALCHNQTYKTQSYSNEKIFFQSFFMLITVQFFFFASA